MPRQRDIDRPVRLTTTLPESERAKLDLFLFSPVEGRVPKGAYQSFIIERLQEYFEWSSLDLAPFGFSGGFFVKGPKAMIDALERRLTEELMP